MEKDIARDTPRAEINMARIPVDGGIAGLIFAIGTMAIFVVGIPAIRYMLPAAVVLGCGLAVVFRFVRHETAAGAGIFGRRPR